MISSALRRPVVLAGAIAATLFAPLAHAAVLTWDGSNTGNTQADGGNGVWDALTPTPTANWWNGSADVVWPATGLDNDALFGNTAGTVSIDPLGVTVNDVQFSTTGYILSGGGTITLNGTTPTMRVNTGTAAIGNNTALVLAGTAGLTKAGAGTLTLNGSAVHTFTGGLNVNAGTLGLSFVNLATPTNLIDSGNALSFGGGTLSITGKGAGAATSQTFASTFLNAGASTVSLNLNAGTSNTIDFGAITRNPGATLQLSTSASDARTTTTTLIAKTSGSVGLLGGWATTGSGVSIGSTATTGLTYAYLDASGRIIPSATNATNDLVTGQGPGTWKDNPGRSHQNSGGGTLTGPSTVNLYRSVNSTAPTIDFGATSGWNLTINGILNAGSNTLTFAPGSAGNKLIIGATKELIVLGPTSVTISAPIENNGAGASAVTYSGGGTLLLSGSNTYSGGTFINSGTVQVGPGGVTSTSGSLGTGSVTNRSTLAINRSDAFTLGNNISGTGVVNLLGAGTVTISGTNTYTGATNVNAGRLDLTGSLTSNITVLGGANLGGEGTTTGSLSFTGISQFFFDPVTSSFLSANTISSTGTVNVVLTSPTTGTGLVVMQALNGITGVLNTNFTLAGRGTLYWNNPANPTQLLYDYTVAGLAWRGNDPTNPTFWDVNTTSNWVSGIASAKFNTGDPVLFDDTATSYTVAVQGASVSPSGVTFDNSTHAYTISGVIAGNGSIVKEGTNDATLTGLNTYTGGTNINNGTITLGDGLNVAAVGSGNIGITGAGALVVNFGAASGTLANNITGSGIGAGPLTKNGAGTLTLTGTNSYGTTSISAGTIQLGDGTAATGTFGAGKVTNNGAIVTNFGGNNAIVSNVIEGTGTFTQSGTGTVSLTGATSTYSGLTTISAGTLQIGAGGTTGVTSAGSYTIAAGAFLAFNRSDDLSVSNTIGGAGGVKKLGAGVLTLSSTNSYSGTTTVSNGTLLVTNPAALGTTTGGASVVSGGTITLKGDITVSGETLLLEGEGFNTAGALRNSSGNNEWTGNVTLVSAGNNRIASNAGNLKLSGTVATAGGILVLQGDGTGEVSGVISGTGSLIRSSNGTGTWTLSGANTFTGKTTLSNGSLKVFSLNSTGANAVASSSLGAPTTVGNATIDLGNSTLIYAGAGETTNRIISLVSVAAGTIDQSGTGSLKFTSDFTTTGTAGTRLLNLQGSTAGTGEIGGVVPDFGANKTSLTKLGSGTWTLSGANTYTGNTTINAGTVLITGNVLSATIDVQTGGTLGGTSGLGNAVGGIATAVNIKQDSTLAPGLLTVGNTIGTLNLGTAGGTSSVTFTGTTGHFAKLSIDLDGASNLSDQLVVNGSLNLGAFDQLNASFVNAFTFDSIHTYTIATYTGTLTGTFDSLNLPGGATIDYGTLSNSSITLTVVPEPAAVSSLLGGLGLLLGRRRRG